MIIIISLPLLIVILLLIFLLGKSGAGEGCLSGCLGIFGQAFGIIALIAVIAFLDNFLTDFVEKNQTLLQVIAVIAWIVAIIIALLVVAFMISAEKEKKELEKKWESLLEKIESKRQILLADMPTDYMSAKCNLGYDINIGFDESFMYYLQSGSNKYLIKAINKYRLEFFTKERKNDEDWQKLKEKENFKTDDEYIKRNLTKIYEGETSICPSLRIFKIPIKEIRYWQYLPHIGVEMILNSPRSNEYAKHRIVVYIIDGIESPPSMFFVGRIPAQFNSYFLKKIPKYQKK